MAFLLKSFLVICLLVQLLTLLTDSPNSLAGEGNISCKKSFGLGSYFVACQNFRNILIYRYFDGESVKYVVPNKTLKTFAYDKDAGLIINENEGDVKIGIKKYLKTEINK
eukprot:NODE_7_length_67686_cov_1.621421.p59 type:complete len:110 gc:universal NODE_7_length_67686_cov_1.621421:16455-16126(-)